jgi:hypothetical protein
MWESFFFCNGGFYLFANSNRYGIILKIFNFSLDFLGWFFYYRIEDSQTFQKGVFMIRRSILTFLLTTVIILFMANSIFSADRVYWDEAGDTIYVSSFPARVDLHMRFDFTSQGTRVDSLYAMIHPFTWAGSNGVDSLIQKSCDMNGWWAGSKTAPMDLHSCRFDPPDKQMVNALRFIIPFPVEIPPGTHYLYAVWSFMVGQENAILCMDSTFMPQNMRLRWGTTSGRLIYPEYTKKCWVIAKIPCGDANFDWIVDIVDMVYLIKYFFYNGPNPVGNSDVNSDGIVDIVDIPYLGNYIFHGGEEPNCP